MLGQSLTIYDMEDIDPGYFRNLKWILENEITHLAVYLGEGLYLSKFGTFGGLIVTTLRGMKMGFGGTKTWLTRPARLDSGGAPIVNSGAR